MAEVFSTVPAWAIVATAVWSALVFFFVAICASAGRADRDEALRARAQTYRRVLAQARTGGVDRAPRSPATDGSPATPLSVASARARTAARRSE
jgi:hypothetical protein